MRTLHASLLFVAASACASLNPDYQQLPDDALRELLATAPNTAAMSEVDRERIQFGVERLATRYPSHVPSQVAAAAIAQASGQTQRAQGYADRAIELHPANVEARCVRVRIAVADGSMSLARKLVDDGIRMRPDAAPLYEASAWLHQLNSQYDDAVDALDAAAALGAPPWRIAFHKGLAEELRGDADKAAAHYRAALNANSTCVEAQQRLTGLEARRQLNSGK